MPTRTALVISIGDVIDSGPPLSRRKRRSVLVTPTSTTAIQCPSSPDSTSSSSLSTEDVQRHQTTSTMKTRTLTQTTLVHNNCTDSSLAMTNGYNGIRKTRLISADQLYNSSSPLSPRTRSSAKQEALDQDSSIENSDKMILSGDSSGDKRIHSNGDSRPGPLSSKKKRRSVNEKFLEDNSEYYGFQVLSSKLRSNSEMALNSSATCYPSSTSVTATTCHTSSSSSCLSCSPLSNSSRSSSVYRSIWNFLQGQKNDDSAFHSDDATIVNGDAGVTVTLEDHLDKSQKSGTLALSHSDASKRSRQSAVDKHKSTFDESSGKLCGSGDLGTLEDALCHSEPSDDHAALSGVDTQDEGNKKGAAQGVNLNRKRRSELDKLLEAGSSSFHFETAKESAFRLNGDHLGPIHVEVDMKAEPESECQIKPSLDQDNSVGNSNSEAIASSHVADNVLIDSASSSPDKSRPCSDGSKKRKSNNQNAKMLRRKRQRVLSKEAEDVSKLEPRGPLGFLSAVNVLEELNSKLRMTDGSSIDLDALEFSFERTPWREGWFQTYTRQDQGDEILYYPEPKSFLLPYEMPVSTFYPKKDGPGGREEKKKLGNKASRSETVSTVSSSKVPSGTVSPDEQEPYTSVCSQSFKPQTRRKNHYRSSGQKKESCSFSFLLEKLGPKAASTVREFSRKSPRGHASTKSLISSAVDNSDSFADEDTVDMEPIQLSKAVKMTMLLSHVLDECSNDSAVSQLSVNSNSSSIAGKKYRVAVTDSNSGQELNELALRLDDILRTEDPELLGAGDDKLNSELLSSAKNKVVRRRRPSSVDKARARSGKSRKVAETGLASTTVCQDPMDRLVACHVDEILLDCLEDELPSVPLDGDLPGTEALELVQSFAECDSMLLCNSRKVKPRPYLRGKALFSSNLAGTSTLLNPESSEDQPKLSEEHPSSASIEHSLPSVTPQSTILKQLLMSPPKRSKVDTETSNSFDPIKRKDDSSSECNISACETMSVTSSVTSSCAGSLGRRRKRMNRTGFPNSKRRRKSWNGGQQQQLLAQVLSHNASKKSTPTIRTMEEENAVLQSQSSAKTIPAETTSSSQGRKVKRSASPVRKRGVPSVKSARTNNNNDVVNEGDEDSDHNEAPNPARKASLRSAAHPSRRANYLIDEDEDEDGEDEDDSADEKPKQVRRQQAPSKQIKVFVRKKKAGSSRPPRPNVRRRAQVAFRKSNKAKANLPNSCKSKRIESSNHQEHNEQPDTDDETDSDEDDDDVDDETDEDSDDEEEEEEQVTPDEPIRESQRLKRKKIHNQMQQMRSK